MPRPGKAAGSVALVSGANRGIGLAFVRELTARGAKKVYAGVRDPDALTNEFAGLPAEVVHGRRRAGQVRQGPGPLRARHDQAAQGHGHGHGAVAVTPNRWAELRQVGFAALEADLTRPPGSGGRSVSAARSQPAGAAAAQDSMIRAAGSTAVMLAADSPAYMAIAPIWPVAAAPGGDPWPFGSVIR